MATEHALNAGGRSTGVQRGTQTNRASSTARSSLHRNGDRSQ